MQIRFVVANIQSGIGVTKGYRQYLTSGWRYLLPHPGEGALQAGNFLRMEEADIALLTEVDAGSRRSRNTSQMDVISEESGIPHARFFPTRSMGTSINEGNAVLSRFPVTSDTAHALVSRMNPRVLGSTSLLLPNETSMTALVVHLALSAQPRALQFAEIAEHIKRIDGPVVLGGDFNERDPRILKQFERIGLTPVTVPGYPSWKPRHALQVLFLSRHFSLVRASVPNHARFSDHLPLIVEARLTP